VVPAGKTADKFYEKFTEEISNTGANLERVHFYVGEDFYPLRKDHPMSFSGSLKRNLEDKIEINPENIHYVEERKSLEDNVEVLRRLGQESADIFIAGLNESGAICGLRSSLQWMVKSLYMNLIDLRETEEIAKLKEPDWFKKVHADVSELLGPEAMKKYFSDLDLKPTHIMTYGYVPIIESKELIIIASGKKKKTAMERFMLGLDMEILVGSDRIRGKGDNLQSNSLSEIINYRCNSPYFAQSANKTLFYLDRDAMPSLNGESEK
ncbi:MAG: hypothetical protein AABY22_34265, partial [Nanoarchaeota archaeon]